MIAVPTPLFHPRRVGFALDRSALAVSPFCWCKSEAALKVSLAYANIFLFVFQGKLGVPGLPGYPGRQGPKVTRWGSVLEGCGVCWGPRRAPAELCWWCCAEGSVPANGTRWNGSISLLPTRAG